jgi:hypothetical protein
VLLRWEDYGFGTDGLRKLAAYHAMGISM